MKLRIQAVVSPAIAMDVLLLDGLDWQMARNGFEIVRCAVASTWSCGSRGTSPKP